MMPDAFEDGFVAGYNARDNEIVSCRECAYLGKNDWEDRYICKHSYGMMNPKLTDFCSCGERRTE